MLSPIEVRKEILLMTEKQLDFENSILDTMLNIRLEVWRRKTGSLSSKQLLELGYEVNRPLEFAGYKNLIFDYKQLDRILKCKLKK